MKTFSELLKAGLPQKVFLIMAIVVTIGIAFDSALHASHVMVFFSLIVLSVLFLSMYAESEKHELGVSVMCLVLGSIYPLFLPVDFTWWRFILYTIPLYISGILFIVSWLASGSSHHHHHGLEG